MGKPTICIDENKGADQLRSNCEAISAFVFAIRIVQFLYFPNPKCPASNHFLHLYSSVYVSCVRKPHCWFFHEVAQLYEPSETNEINTEPCCGITFLWCIGGLSEDYVTSFLLSKSVLNIIFFFFIIFILLASFQFTNNSKQLI